MFIFICMIKMEIVGSCLKDDVFLFKGEDLFFFIVSIFLIVS